MSDKNEEAVFEWVKDGEKYKFKVNKTGLDYVAFNSTVTLCFKDFSRLVFKESFFNPECSLRFYGRDSKKPVIDAKFDLIEMTRVADFYKKEIRPLISKGNEEKRFVREKKLLSHTYYGH